MFYPSSYMIVDDGQFLQGRVKAWYTRNLVLKKVNENSMNLEIKSQQISLKENGNGNNTCTSETVEIQRTYNKRDMKNLENLTVTPSGEKRSQGRRWTSLVGTLAKGENLLRSTRDRKLRRAINFLKWEVAWIKKIDSV